MKSEKGVTLTSIMIYVVALTIVVGIVGRITTYFYKNIQIHQQMQNIQNSIVILQMK